MPRDTPGTPPGNSSLRSPGSGFLVLNHSPDIQSPGSKLTQPPSGSATAASRRFRIGQDGGVPFGGARPVAGFPGVEREQLARGVAELAPRLRQRLEQLARVDVRARIDQEPGGAQRRKIAQHLLDAAVGGNLLVELGGSLRIGLRQSSRLAQARELAIGRRAIGGDLRKRLLSFCVLAGLGELDGVIEAGADQLRLPRQVPLVEAPAADAQHDEQYRPDNEVLVPLPQLHELFAADFFVDFAEDVVGHVVTPRPDYPRQPGPFGSRPSAR
jgi:hypothetical protein